MSAEDGAAEIALTRGLVAVVDQSDHAALARYRWYAVPRSNGKGFYAARNSNGARVWMHRAILRAPAGVLVDHKDGDGLNNRRGNLRLASHQQNNWNRRLDSKGGVRGVRPVVGGWAARICTAKGKTISLGVYATPEAAAKAYDAAARSLRGEFALVNFETMPEPTDEGDRMDLATTALEVGESPVHFHRRYADLMDKTGFPPPRREPLGGLTWSRSAVDDWKRQREAGFLARVKATRRET